MSSRVMVALRIAATPERVFEAFTRDINSWWRPNPMFRFTQAGPGMLAIEPLVGGRFTETQADGTEFEIGKVTHWEPGVRLGLTWRQASFIDDQSTLVDVRFEAIGTETRVTVEHLGWDSIPAPHAARHGMVGIQFLKRHGEWWRDLLAAVKADLSRP
ncbi:SRPBCC domain-containing protein [Sphingomonas sp. QA11]|uniref:SRPBCC domain-containing protein n=1 Tax=Sphingomonas sp. QA11 TaxID=2950605 RepID=UPI00234B9A74|nr:SRPBCC domain-containing protein [Sphingomonas sp. QA11]WCM27142.1 SRPBCC domain-containing protein [Sphingomonas sp. QA11]